MSSWLSSIADGIGSVFGYDTLGDDIAGIFSPEDLLSTTNEASPNYDPIASIFTGSGSGSSNGSIVNPFGIGGGSSGGGNTGVSLWPSIIGAGTQLAGSYFGQANSKENAEAYAQSVANQIAAQKELDEKKLQNAKDIAQIYAGASAGASRKSTLASLYNNWANNTAQGGANQAQAAIGTGKAITDGINARAAVLR